MLTASKAGDGLVDELLAVVDLGDVSGHLHDVSGADLVALPCDLLQVLLATGRQHQPRTPAGIDVRSLLHPTAKQVERAPLAYNNDPSTLLTAVLSSDWLRTQDVGWPRKYQGPSIVRCTGILSSR